MSGHLPVPTAPRGGFGFWGGSANSEASAARRSGLASGGAERGTTKIQGMDGSHSNPDASACPSERAKRLSAELTGMEEVSTLRGGTLTK